MNEWILHSSTHSHIVFHNKSITRARVYFSVWRSWYSQLLRRAIIIQIILPTNAPPAAEMCVMRANVHHFTLKSAPSKNIFANKNENEFAVVRTGAYMPLYLKIALAHCVSYLNWNNASTYIFRKIFDAISCLK